MRACAVDLVIIAGWSDYDRTRSVADNLAPGGVQTATADYDGYFIAPVADTVHFEPYFGVEGRARLDDNNVDAILLGQSISFDPGGDDNVGAALAGAQLVAEIDDGVVLFGQIETAVDTDNGRLLSGQVGLSVSF